MCTHGEISSSPLQLAHVPEIAFQRSWSDLMKKWEMHVMANNVKMKEECMHSLLSFLHFTHIFFRRPVALTDTSSPTHISTRTPLSLQNTTPIILCPLKKGVCLLPPSLHYRSTRTHVKTHSTHNSVVLRWVGEKKKKSFSIIWFLVTFHEHSSLSQNVSCGEGFLWLTERKTSPQTSTPSSK